MLESVGQALVIDPEARHWEQFDPLDEHLGDGLFSELKENLDVQLVEVRGRNLGQQVLEEEQESLSLLRGPTQREYSHHVLVDELSDQVVLPRRDHQSQLLAD